MPLPPKFQLQKKKYDLEELLKSCINSNETKFKNQEASIRNLETQVAQLVNLISKKTHDFLPSNIEKNPKEEVKTITPRNGKELKERQKRIKEDIVEEIIESPKLDEFESSKIAP